jgi:hypothetical protein
MPSPQIQLTSDAVPSCSGTANDRNGRRLQRVVSFDLECTKTWSSDYEIVGLMRSYHIPNLQHDSEPWTTLRESDGQHGRGEVQGALSRTSAQGAPPVFRLSYRSKHCPRMEIPRGEQEGGSKLRLLSRRVGGQNNRATSGGRHQLDSQGLSHFDRVD